MKWSSWTPNAAFCTVMSNITQYLCAVWMWRYCLSDFITIMNNEGVDTHNAWHILSLSKGFLFFHFSLRVFYTCKCNKWLYDQHIIYHIHQSYVCYSVSLPESMFPIHAQYKQHFNTTALSVCVREKTYHSSLFIWIDRRKLLWFFKCASNMFFMLF